VPRKKIVPKGFKKNHQTTVTITDDIDITTYRPTAVVYVKHGESKQHAWSYTNYQPVPGDHFSATLDVTPDGGSVRRLGLLGRLIALFFRRFQTSTGTLTVSLQNGLPTPSDVPQDDVSVS
jgi:hypothetical protein